MNIEKPRAGQPHAWIEHCFVPNGRLTRKQRPGLKVDEPVCQKPDGFEKSVQLRRVNPAE
jgi:hypothetical protein